MATIVGGAGGELLNGGAPADLIIGNGGNDTINGLGGNDTIWGDAAPQSQVTTITFSASYDVGDIVSITVDGITYSHTVVVGGTSAEAVYDALRAVQVGGVRLDDTLAAKGVDWPSNLSSNAVELTSAPGAANAFTISASTNNDNDVGTTTSTADFNESDIDSDDVVIVVVDGNVYEDALIGGSGNSLDDSIEDIRDELIGDGYSASYNSTDEILTVNAPISLAIRFDEDGERSITWSSATRTVSFSDSGTDNTGDRLFVVVNDRAYSATVPSGGDVTNAVISLVNQINADFPGIASRSGDQITISSGNTLDFAIQIDGDDFKDNAAINNTTSTPSNQPAPTVSTTQTAADPDPTVTGDDVINGGTGADTIYAGPGNDTVTTAEGGGFADGGAGIDLLIVQTEDDDADIDMTRLVNQTLTENTSGGSPTLTFVNFERINFSTDDTDTDDTVLGGDYDDTITSTGGQDYFNGRGGNDSINYNDAGGQDFIVTLIGGDGNDTIDGGDDRDWIDGGADNDLIFARDDDDTIDGGSGNDTIDAGDDNDSVFGGTGDDSILGGNGNDTIDGGTGNDTIRSSGSGNDTIIGGDGNDLVDIGGTNGAHNVSLGGGDDSLSALDADGNSTIDAGSGNDTLNFVVAGANGIFSIELGSGDDVVRGDGLDSGGINTINGGDGNDSIDMDIALSAARADLGSGDDTFLGSEISNRADSVDGGSGNDSIRGGDGNDTIRGGSGNDTIDGGSENDSIDAGDDNDSVSGGSGFDTLDGGSGNDTINGGSGNDQIFAGTGNDSIDGDADNDTIFAESGDDYVAGGSGFDSLNGGADNDTIYGEDGDDRIDGDTGNDYMDGGAGNDTIIGGTGNDSIEGGADNDSITGGEGVDRFVVTEYVSGSINNGDDTITDYEYGEWFTGFTIDEESDVSIEAAGANTRVRIDTNNNGTFDTDIILLGDYTDANVIINPGSGNGFYLMPNRPPEAQDTTASVTEDDTVAGAVAATDPDGDSVTFETVGTVPAGLTFNPDGTWSYDPPDSFQSLGEGDSDTVSFEFRAYDGSLYSDPATVTITITGVNDAATFGGDTAGAVTEDNILQASGLLTVSDIDTGEDSFGADTIVGSYGTLTIGTDGAWTYDLDNADPAVQGLGAGDTMSDTITVASADGTIQDVVITINGVNDAARIFGTDSRFIYEGTEGPVIGRLRIDDPDVGEEEFREGTFTGAYGTLRLMTDGTWLYEVDNANPMVDGLDGGERLLDTITIEAADGTTHEITVTIVGTSELTTGTAGADSMLGTPAPDLIEGFGGDDTMTGLDGADTLDGGDGFDLADYSTEAWAGGTTGIYANLGTGIAIDGFGNTDLLIGVEGVIGTDGGYLGEFTADELSDILIGDNGSNLIEGRGGRDYLLGLGGNDTILGEEGDDLALGGDGDDSLQGGVGDDFLLGENGSDTLLGGAGDDWLVGAFWDGASTGSDMAFGGAGDDVIIVGDPNLATSTLMGFGEAGNDTLYGGAGDDWLVGGQGSDYVWGSGGADVFRFEAGDLASGDMDILLMGTGEGDLLSFDASYTGQVSAVAGSNGGVDGVYLTVAGTTWMAWLPYQSLANVEAALIYG